MSVHLVQIVLSTDDSVADLAAAVDIDLYQGKHDLGTSLVVVAAYKAGQVWQPYPWKWFASGDNEVILEVPAGTDMSPHEILLIG